MAYHKENEDALVSTHPLLPATSRKENMQMPKYRHTVHFPVTSREENLQMINCEENDEIKQLIAGEYQGNQYTVGKINNFQPRNRQNTFFL